MTSNVGAQTVTKYRDEMLENNPNYSEKADENINQLYLKDLRNYLKPEFINRIDVICIFHPLTNSDLTKIATIMIANINKRLIGQGLELKMTARALDYIIKKGTNLMYGARPLKRYIQQEVEDRIAEKMLLGEIDRQGTVIIDYQSNTLTFTSSN